MQIIGLTCRVGRAVSGSAEIIRDLIEGGGSILVIGPPGVGKTTLIRYALSLFILRELCEKYYIMRKLLMFYGILVVKFKLIELP